MTNKARVHRRWAPVLLAASLALFWAGCGGTVNNPEESATGSSAAVRASANRLAETRVFFAHQSVGDNIMDGIASLEKEMPGAGPRLTDLSTASQASGGFFAHARLGTNGDPKSKTDAFISALESGLGNKVDIAFQKYCFADFEPTTDAKAVFAYYQQGIERVHREFPGVKVVHVTAPLMDVQRGPRAFVKKLLGRVPDHYDENLVREQFNDLMRQTYQGHEPLFDLATLESSRPGGPREALSLNGKTVYALLPEYTFDGGHLNETSQRRVAAALLAFLADLDLKHEATPPPSQVRQ